jgi:uncharacterized protein DUF4386
MLRLSDARNFGRTLTGLCLIVGPLMFVIASAIGPDVDDDNKVKELANVAANKGSYLLGAILFLVGSILVLVASIGLIRVFANRRVTLGQIAGGLLVVGSAATVAFYAFETVEYEMVNISGLDRAQMAKLLDKGQEANSGIPIFLMFVVGIVIGLILLAIASWRSSVVPVWAALALLVSAVLGFVGESKGVEIASFVLLVVGLGSIGMAVLGMSDDEWGAKGTGATLPPAAAPPPPPAAPAV